MTIPKELQGKYEEIAPIIVKFCDEKLSEDYKELCLKLLVKLCRKRPSPLLGGKPHTWAAGIVYAIGQNNFITDKTQKIHMSSGELAAGFGVSGSTAAGKAAEIRRMFKIDFFNAEWQLPEILKDNPAIWMVQVNGLIVDIRDMPLELQEQAFRKGIIPYIPGERAESSESENSGMEDKTEQRNVKPKEKVKPNPGQPELPL